jgi:hypothetical protein
VAGLSGGPHDLTDKALCSRRSASLVADSAGTNMEVIFRLFHDEQNPARNWETAQHILNFLAFREKRRQVA